MTMMWVFQFAWALFNVYFSFKNVQVARKNVASAKVNLDNARMLRGRQPLPPSERWSGVQ